MIWNDMSYISDTDMLAVEHGYAKIDVHSLRLSAYNGDVIYENINGKKRLRGYSRSLSKPEQEERVHAVVEAVNKRFKVYQYVDKETIPFKSKWDLFFWCNHKEVAKGGARDFSYVTLSFNNYWMTHEERTTLLDTAIAFIKSLNIDIDVAIQHDLHWDNDKVSETVKAFCESNEGMMMQYGRHTGKIRRINDGEFGFFKKGARKYYIPINETNKEILMLEILKDMNAQAIAPERKTTVTIQLYG